jgi:hypothetical protein
VSALEFGFAPTDACLDPNGNTCSKNNMPVGSTIRVMLWFGSSETCNSANINWGDGDIDYGVSDGDAIVFTEHTFKKSGSFQCVATTTCGGASASISVTVTGGFGGGSDASVAVQSLGLAGGVIGAGGMFIIRKRSMVPRRPRKLPSRGIPSNRRTVSSNAWITPKQQVVQPPSTVGPRYTSTPAEVRTTFTEGTEFIQPNIGEGILEAGMAMVTTISLNEGTNFVAQDATIRRIDNLSGCNVQQLDANYKVTVQGRWDTNPWVRGIDYTIENPRTDGFEIRLTRRAPPDAMIDWKIIR